MSTRETSDADHDLWDVEHQAPEWAQLRRLARPPAALARLSYLLVEGCGGSLMRPAVGTALLRPTVMLSPSSDSVEEVEEVSAVVDPILSSPSPSPGSHA